MRKTLILVIVVAIILIVVASAAKNRRNDTSDNISNPQEKVLSVVSDQEVSSILNSSVVWSADHETADLSQWSEEGGGDPIQDSGLCKRPSNGVTREFAHSGEYSIKMSVNSWFPGSGCRQFRYPEARTEKPHYYSAWIYLPKNYKIGGWTNLIQFKAKSYDSESEGESKLFWALRLDNRDNNNMYLELFWDKDSGLVGPTSDDAPGNTRSFTQQIKDFPANEWVHVEVYLDQSSEFDGHIAVWQDGVELFNIENVRTKMPNSYNSWSVNSYGGNIRPNPFVVYVDDAVISTERIGSSYKINQEE